MIGTSTVSTFANGKKEGEEQIYVLFSDILLEENDYEAGEHLSSKKYRYGKKGELRSREWSSANKSICRVDKHGGTSTRFNLECFLSDQVPEKKKEKNNKMVKGIGFKRKTHAYMEGEFRYSL